MEADEDEDDIATMKTWMQHKAKKYVAREVAAALAALQTAQPAAPPPPPQPQVHSAYADAFTMARANLMNRVSDQVKSQCYAQLFPNRAPV